MKLAFAALAVALAVTPASSANFTTPFAVPPDQFVDLGVGPMEVQVDGNQTVSLVIADTQPPKNSKGQHLSAGALTVKCQVQHVWALGFGFGSSVVVTPTACVNSGDARSARYPLAVNVNSAMTTNPIGPVIGGNYLFNCMATSGSWSAQPQSTGPDGITYLTGGVAPALGNVPQKIAIGAGSYVQLVISGNPVGLFCDIAGVGG